MCLGRVLPTLFRDYLGEQGDIAQTEIGSSFARGELGLTQRGQPAKPALQNLVSAEFQDSTRLSCNDRVGEATFSDGCVDMSIGKSSDDARHPGCIPFRHSF